MATVVNYTNCVEYNEYITGERNEALISTLRPFVAKLSDATKYGIQILVLVLSGVSTRETLRTYAYRPSAVLDGVGDIAALARAGKKPD